MMSEQRAAKQTFEHVLRDLESLSPLFKNKKFKELMEKVTLSDDKSKTQLLEAELPEKDKLTLQLLMLVSKIYDLYKVAHLQAEEPDIVIRIASRLDQKQEESLVKTIRKSRGENARVRFEYDPSLLGGVQIYEKNTFIDYSLQGQLQKLEKQLKKSE